MVKESTVKHGIACATLAVCGIASLAFGKVELAGVCFGAIAGYAFKNGVASNGKTGTEESKS